MEKKSCSLNVTHWISFRSLAWWLQTYRQRALFPSILRETWHTWRNKSVTIRTEYSLQRNGCAYTCEEKQMRKRTKPEYQTYTKVRIEIYPNGVPVVKKILVPTSLKKNGTAWVRKRKIRVTWRYGSKLIRTELVSIISKIKGSFYCVPRYVVKGIGLRTSRWHRTYDVKEAKRRWSVTDKNQPGVESNPQRIRLAKVKKWSVLGINIQDTMIYHYEEDWISMRASTWDLLPKDGPVRGRKWSECSPRARTFPHLSHRNLHEQVGMHF